MSAERCNVFHWIGQPITSCDNCGKPIFEHDYQHGQSEVLFGPLAVVPFSAETIDAWLVNRWITRARAKELAGVSEVHADE